MNHLTFLKTLLAIMSRDWVVYLVDMVRDRCEDMELILPNRQERVSNLWAAWLEQRRTGKWQGYALRTISSLASQTGSRPEALELFARDAYKVALMAAHTRAHAEVQKIKASKYNNADEATLKKTHTDLVAKAKGRLDALVQNCK